MEDLINRRDAIDAIDEIESEVVDGDGFQYAKWRQFFCDLPSADVPERNVGKWTEKEVIHAEEAKEIITEWQSCKCSVCGRYHTEPYMYYFNEPRFCSWCGAKMKGEEDAEVH